MIYIAPNSYLNKLVNYSDDLFMDMIQGISSLNNAENAFKVQMAVAAKIMQAGRQQGQTAIALLEAAVEGFEQSIEESSVEIINQLDVLA